MKAISCVKRENIINHINYYFPNEMRTEYNTILYTERDSALIGRHLKEGIEYYESFDPLKEMKNYVEELLENLPIPSQFKRNKVGEIIYEEIKKSFEEDPDLKELEEAFRERNGSKIKKIFLKLFDRNLKKYKRRLETLPFVSLKTEMPLTLESALRLYHETLISFIEWGKEKYSRAINILLMDKGGFRLKKKPEIADKLILNEVKRVAEKACTPILIYDKIILLLCLYNVKTLDDISKKKIKDISFKNIPESILEEYTFSLEVSLFELRNTLFHYTKLPPVKEIDPAIVELLILGAS